MGWFYPTLNFFIVALVYFVFIYNNLFAQMQLLQEFHIGDERTYIDSYVRRASLTELVVVAASFHVFLILFLSCMARAVLTPPGSVPPVKVWRQGFYIPPRIDATLVAILSNPNYAKRHRQTLKDFMESIPVVERKHNRQLRWCVKCGVFKPDRCHHCRHCDDCVLRMDHHCPYLSNCIGFNNYKFFVLMLFYALVCLMFVLVDMFWRFYHCFRPVMDWKTFLRADFLIAFTYILCGVVAAALLFFFNFHLYLVFKGLTTIELKEKSRAQREDVRHAFKMIHLKFDNGYFKNFMHVFGSPWMWLLPIAPTSLEDDDGTYTNIAKLKNTVLVDEKAQP